MAGLWLALALSVPAGVAWSETPSVPGNGASAEAGEQRDLFDAEGFRLRDYRAQVPSAPPGAVVVTLAELQALKDGGAVLIDVMGLQHFHIDEAGHWITPRGADGPHLSIPGAVWLPVIGWGSLEDWQQDYLRQSLTALTGGDLTRPVLVFCRVDCWLSWNAARRIAALGFTRVYWSPGGSDDWSDAGLSLEPLAPFPLHSGTDRPFAP